MNVTTMRIAGVEFPEPLLNALCDGRLVIFAGAGVSMGEPVHLPSFRNLACQLACGTTLSISHDEPEYLFLSRLEKTGPDIHQKAPRYYKKTTRNQRSYTATSYAYTEPQKTYE